MRRTTQIVLIAVATGVLGIALILWLQTARTEPALAWARPVPSNTRVEKSDVKVVQVSQARKFSVATDPASVVGRYTTRPIQGEGLVVPSDTTDSLPEERFVFDNGEILPLDTNAYGFELLTNPLSAFVLQPGDLVDVYLVVPGEEQMYLLLQEQPIVYRLDDPLAVIAVALDAPQIAVVEGMMSKVLEQREQRRQMEEEGRDIEIPEPYYLVLPAQGENSDRSPLEVYPFVPADPALMSGTEE